MAAQGLPVSIAGVAQAYRDFLDILVVDTRDAQGGRGTATVRPSGPLHQHDHEHIRRKSRTGSPGVWRYFLPKVQPTPAQNRHDSGSGQKPRQRQATPRGDSRPTHPHRTRASHAARCARNSCGTGTDCPEVGIVTSDPFALQLAQQFHFTVIADTNNRSETDAIEIATRYCESHGIDNTPGDSWLTFL